MAKAFEVELEAILDDGRLAEAMRAFAQGLTDLYAQPPLGVPILGDLGRFSIVASLIASPTPMTRTAVLDLMGPGAAGRARVASHLGALIGAGALEAVDDPSDGRSRPLSPAPWLRDWMDRWGVAMFAPVHPWWPGPGPVPAPTREVLAAYLQQILAANRAGLNAFGATPGVWRIMSLVGGHLFLLELILASDGARRIGLPLPFSRRAFARRYGVSRRHAVDLVAEAERLGWLTRRASKIDLSATFADEARRWVAIHIALCNAALAGRLLPVMSAASLSLAG